MLKMDYKNYLDKVYGCFLGKALIGNIGAPYEGMKQYLDFQYSEEFFKEMIPNDDLDLQVLWLEVLEKKGKYFTSKDLADIFYEKCPYAPGEYATFKRNYEKGIYPPYSGSFNAEMFANGMGSPIRSEIWACIAPNNPLLAAEYAKRDSCLDHPQGSDSENGEIFFAVMEALAFAKRLPQDNVYDFALDLIREAEAFIPADCKLRKLIDDTLDWYGETGDFKYTRGQIIRFYGDTEATICYQNIGFILLSMLSGKMDFLQCGMDALRCGFDTDCTCATVGALLGILYGAEEIEKRYGLRSATFKLGVSAVRRSDDIKDLSEDIAAVGYYFSLVENDKMTITDYRGKLLEVKAPDDKIGFSVEYVGEPSIAFGAQKTVRLCFVNKTDAHLKLDVALRSRTGLHLSLDTFTARVEARDALRIELVVSADARMPFLEAANKIDVRVCAEGCAYGFDFGLSGAKQWQIAGPFWRNIVEVPPLQIGEGYWGHVATAKFGNMQPIDLIRHYHMNSLPADGELAPCDVFGADKKDPAYLPRYINTPSSDFVLEAYENFKGQANYYLKTVVYSTTAKNVSLQVGFTDTCKVWLNGDLVAVNNGSNKFTHENLHIEGVNLKEGENELVVMLSKIGEVTRFGYDFVVGSACSDHVTQLATKNLALSK